MNARILKVATAALLAGCAVGPAYRPAPVVPAATEVGTCALADSTRAFFDSLAAARAADTRPPDRAVPAAAAADGGFGRRSRLGGRAEGHDAHRAWWGSRCSRTATS